MHSGGGVFAEILAEGITLEVAGQGLGDLAIRQFRFDANGTPSDDTDMDVLQLDISNASAAWRSTGCNRQFDKWCWYVAGIDTGVTASLSGSLAVDVDAVQFGDLLSKLTPAIVR